ncbi:neurogenic protein big brain-like protein, partial [Dinothrombium tinctorium]
WAKKNLCNCCFFHSVSVPGHQGALGISLAHDQLGSWQIFGVEFVLTFLVVFTIFATLDHKSFGSDSLSVGIAYLVCSLSGVPASGASMNPARTLGPAFVMNRWKHHWVYWIAPITGGMLAALIYHFIFDTKKLGKIVRRTLYDLEKENNHEYDSELETKASNKSSVGNALITHSGSSYSTSGSSNSSGVRSNHVYSGLQGSNNYDNYRTSSVITADALGSGQFQHTLALPSNNYYSSATYAGIYNTRTPHSLKAMPKMDYICSSNSIASNGQTKF